jgi:purine-binding chemotaxis protein CheW
VHDGGINAIILKIIVQFISKQSLKEEIMEETKGHQIDRPDLEEEEDTLLGKFLTFPLGNEEYGLKIRYVTEIVGIQKITVVPDMPQFVKGVINLRGKVIPVMDVRLRFKLIEKSYDEQTCIIVVNIRNAAVGLIVDTVSEVISICDDNIDPPPSVKKEDASRFIAGLGKVGDNVIILLDIQQLLYDDQFDAVTAVS